MSGEGVRRKSRVSMIRARPSLNDDNIYDVEAIRRKRVYKGQLQYLIKWEGWPENTSTWEPLENLQNVLHLVDKFEKRLKAGIERRKRKKRENSQKNAAPPNPAPPSNANPHFEFVGDEEAASSTN